MRTKDPFLLKWSLQSQSQKIRYELFAKEFLRTGNGVKSYIAVFQNLDPKKKPSKLIRFDANKILKHPYVQYYITKKNKELDMKSDKKILMNRERILKELEDILVATKSEKPGIALKSLDQLAKILGAYAPEKSEVEHKGITIHYIKPEDNSDDNDKK